MERMTKLCALAALFSCPWALAGPVNVNTADAETISAELSGIGLTKAEAIVAYRSEHGPFTTIDDLLNVKGIGERTLELNMDDIHLSGRPQAMK